MLFGRFDRFLANGDWIKRGHTLGLKPGKTGRLPAAGGAAVPILVERSFETPSDIVTGPIARLGHRLSCSQAPASRTANEEEVVVGLSAKRLELAGETLNKPRIHSLVRKSLPLDEDSSFADGSEIGNAHIGPFRARVRKSINCERGRVARLCQVVSTSTLSTARSPFCTVNDNCSLASLSAGCLPTSGLIKGPSRSFSTVSTQSIRNRALR